MELMVAMAITAMIVTALVYITSNAVDTWNRSRAELRAARQAKVMVDTMAKDFESMVVRRGNSFEWLKATNTASVQAPKLTSTNSSDLIFFCAPTDRYNGAYINNATGSFPGDVSCVGYRLYYRDPLNNIGATFQTFVLKRYLSSPSTDITLLGNDPHKTDNTFSNLLGTTDLATAFKPYFAIMDANTSYTDYVCENVFQFVVTFNVEVMHNNSLTIVSVPVGQSSTQVTNSFRVLGNKITKGINDDTPSGVTTDEWHAGRVASVDISLTIISDAGMDQLRSPRVLTTEKQADFLAKNSYNYTKRVQVPGM